VDTATVSSPAEPSHLQGIDSHLPALRWALDAVPDGPVLEFGGGLHSTPAIINAGRDLVTIEPHPDWRMWLRIKYGWEHHTYEVYESFYSGDLPQREWAVVLIDHQPYEGDEWSWLEARAEALSVVRGWCGIALVHDWHIGQGHHERLVRSYQHAAWYAPSDGSFHTALCSDSIDVAAATIQGGYVYATRDTAPKEFPN